MPLTPDHQSAVDANAEGAAIATWGANWLTILAFLLSGGVALKALLVLDGIMSDEKPVVILLLALASALLVWSIVVNVKRRKMGTLIANVVSVLLLVAAFVFAGYGWR